jgi:alpha-ketoglutarate-dependent taurine dioxygenase
MLPGLPTQDRAELHGRGWLLVDFPDDEPLLELARQVGEPIAARDAAPLPERLIPRDIDDAKPNSLSSRYGFGAFPFHTDAAHHVEPPRILLMRSVGASVDVATHLVDLHGAVGPCLSSLRGGTWIVNAGRTRFYAPVVGRRGRKPAVRFDPGCMRAVSPRAHEVERLLESVLATAGATPISWRRGKALIVDNWRCLHGRPPASDRERVLERVLVNDGGSWG